MAILRPNFHKCNFCYWYEDGKGCGNKTCENYDCLEFEAERVIAKAKKEGLSVTDTIALIKLVSEERR